MQQKRLTPSVHCGVRFVRVHVVVYVLCGCMSLSVCLEPRTIYAGVMDVCVRRKTRYMSPIELRVVIRSKLGALDHDLSFVN